MAGSRFLCVSVDLDGIDCYHAIHGLPAPPEALRDAHLTRGLPRFLDMFRDLGTRSTLFVVGRDALSRAGREVLGRARDEGHEIANHTLDHRYDFSRLADADLKEQVEGGASAIEEAIGSRPVGFRAPGYIISDRVVDVLTCAGCEYDASLLPSPPYHAGKAAMIGTMKMLGRESRSIIGGAGMLAAPRGPYRTGRPYWRPGRGLPELPCSVLPVVGVPYMGTTVALAGERGASVLTRAVSAGRFVGLEFHAIDLMDSRADGLDALDPLRRDVRIPVDAKRRIFESVLRKLVARGFESVTLREASARLFG